jgi:protein TonB
MMSQITPPPGVTNMIVALPDAAASRLVKRVEPVYPEAARKAHVQGKVHFRIQIGPDGHVIKIDLVTGDPMLAQAAEQAVRQWVYRPFTADGKAVSQGMYAATEVTLEFIL